jgi:hypothetical protein
MHATTEHLPPFSGGPGTSSFARQRDARVVAFTREQAADALGGRTVWSISALPSGIATAEALQACLRRPLEEPVTTGWRAVEGDPALRLLASRIEAMLAGVLASPDALGAHDREDYAEAVAAGEALLGEEIAPDDVVVLHDALAAVLADAARGRGAHVVRHLHATDPAGAGGAAAASDFLDRFTHGVDAWVVTGPAGVTAAMPSPGHLDRKETAERGSGGSGLCWRAVLADVVVEDREEHVGGTVGVRPVVAAR